MKVSIVVQLTIAILIVGLLLTVGSIFLFDYLTLDFIEDNMRQRAELITVAIADGISTALIYEEAGIPESTLQKASTYNFIDNFILIDQTYTIHATGNDKFSKDVLQTLPLESVFRDIPTKRTESLYDQHLFYSAQTLRAQNGSTVFPDGNQYALVALIDLERYLDQYNFIKWTIPIENFAFMILLVAATYVLVIYLFRKPLERVEIVLRHAARGNFDVVANERSNTELLTLSDTVNTTVQQTEERTRDLQQAKLEADKANKAKRYFLAKMSHEIRTPLNAILGFTELLLEEEEHPDHKEKVEIISASSQHLLQLINDILDFSKIEDGKMTLDPHGLDIRDAFNKIHSMFSLRAEHENLFFNIRVSPKVPRFILIDGHKLKQVVINLLSNAFKFTHYGEIGVYVSYADGFLSITVNDTGDGIPQDKQDIIFKPFEQSEASTTRKYGGTGLGLSITYSLIRIMGGELTLKSEIGSGSSFSFTIPVLPLPALTWYPENGEGMVNAWFQADPDLQDIVEDAIIELPSMLMDLTVAIKKQDEEKARAATHALKGVTGNLQMEPFYEICENISNCLQQDPIDWNMVHGLEDLLLLFSDMIPKRYTLAATSTVSNISTVGSLKVLVADDIDMNRKLVAIILKNENVEITMAKNGIEVLQHLKENQFDALFLDVQMPIMDGVQTLETLRSDPQYDQLHVIMLTANAQEQDLASYLKLGANSYLVKPISKNQLISTVRALGREDLQ